MGFLLVFFVATIKLVCYQRLQRGFLTLPDVVVASGVNHCFIYCFTCVIETNPQGCILSTKCLCVLLRSSLLIAIATPNKMLESMDLLRVSTQHLNRQVNRVMTRFLLRRICLITTIKSGRFILISAPLNV
jgi:hypothetical protein